MKKTLIRLSLCAAIAALAIVSCKKKNDDTSTKDKMVGTWKLHQVVSDMNNNGNQDAADTTETLDSFAISITFNSNGVGTSYTSGVVNNTFAWAINGNYLVITDSGAAPSALLITSGPSTMLTVKDTSEHPVQFDVFNKQ